MPPYPLIQNVTPQNGRFLTEDSVAVNIIRPDGSLASSSATDSALLSGKLFVSNTVTTGIGSTTHTLAVEPLNGKTLRFLKMFVGGGLNSVNSFLQTSIYTSYTVDVLGILAGLYPLNLANPQTPNARCYLNQTADEITAIAFSGTFFGSGSMDLNIITTYSTLFTIDKPSATPTQITVLFTEV
jgi:hypothetical protein